MALREIFEAVEDEVRKAQPVQGFINSMMVLAYWKKSLADDNCEWTNKV